MEPEYLIAVLFGGREKLDCWLTKAADQLADSEKAKPTALPVAIPGKFQELMRRPREALDGLLEKLDDLGTWSYTIRVREGLATVTDDLTSHVLEAAPIDEWPQIHALAAKYGQNVTVVQE